MNVFVCFSFIVRGDICTCCACEADVFFLKQQCFAQGFTRQVNFTLFWAVAMSETRSLLRHQLQTNRPGWCVLRDAIPPPAAPQLALHSPWDEERTKTDKLSVLCNLLVKAK